MEEKATAEDILYRLGWISIGILIVCTILIKTFPNFFSRWMIPCPFHTITGYYCPGCGGTRAIGSFLSGHILKSIYYHPLIPYMGIGGTIFMVSHMLERLLKGKVRGIKFKGIYVYAMGIILVLQFIIKNVAMHYGFYLI